MSDQEKLYEVIDCGTIGELERAVNYGLSSGWRLHGDLIVYQNKYSETSVRYCQAMIKGRAR